MICPTCGFDGDPAASLKSLSVCPQCGETVTQTPNGFQKAAYEDVKGLSDAEFTALRRARGAVLKAKPR